MVSVFNYVLVTPLNNFSKKSTQDNFILEPPPLLISQAMPTQDNRLSNSTCVLSQLLTCEMDEKALIAPIDNFRRSCLRWHKICTVFVLYCILLVKWASIFMPHTRFIHSNPSLVYSTPPYIRKFL